MLVFLVVTILILTLIGNPIRAGAEGHLDFFESDGYFALKLFGYRIYRGKIRFESNDIKHNNLIIHSGKKQKESEIHLNTNKKDERSIVNIKMPPIMKYLLIERIGFDVRIGKRDDAFFTTMLLGGVKIFLYSALAFVKSRYPNAEIDEKFSPEYNEDKLEADFFGIISVSIADIIISLLTSKLFSKKKKPIREVKKIDSARA